VLFHRLRVKSRGHDVACQPLAVPVLLHKHNGVPDAVAGLEGSTDLSCPRIFT
jgi:hypothetical protein